MTRTFALALILAAAAAVAQADGRAPRAGGAVTTTSAETFPAPRLPRSGGDTGIISLSASDETPTLRRPRAGGPVLSEAEVMASLEVQVH